MKTPILLASALCASALALSAATETLRESHAVAPGASFDLENVNGSVTIVVGDKPEITIEAEKHGKNDEDMKRCVVIIHASDNKVSVETKFEKRAFHWFSDNLSVDYRITVPSTLDKARIETVNGGIRAEGVSGRLNLTTVNGRIQAEDVSNDASVETVNGSTSVSVKSLPAGGELKVETVNGSCELSLPADISAKLHADNVNGSIHCDLPVTIESKNNHKLRATLGTGSGTINVESVNGSLRIHKL